ncbi:MAG: hypothetical protein GXO80_10200 [Chlorobi bacterium]|nr:hypothetical protein [Chlorobiota bacterium]
MALIIHNSDNNGKNFKHEIEENIHNNFEVAKIISKFQDYAKVIDEFQNIDTAQKYILKEIKRLSGGNLVLSESETKELKSIFSNQLELSNKAYSELGLDNIPIAEYEKRNEFEKKFNTSLKISYNTHKSILELLNKYNFKENIISYLERQLPMSEHENSERSLTKIDNKFIEDIRTHFYGITRIISSNEDENYKIVPNEFTHEYLLSNLIINRNIIEYYYKPCICLIKDKEYEKAVEKGFIGKKETMLIPYPFIFYGAYFNRNSLLEKLFDLKYRKELLLNGKKVKYFEDLTPYFKEYAKGFAKGYNEFEAECINKYLNEYSDKNDFSKKVFEYVNKKILFEHDWFNNDNSGFTISSKSNSDIETITGAYEHGEKQGYFYRAWSIILSNNDLYKPYFDKLQASSIERTQTEQKEIKFSDFFDLNKIELLKIEEIHNTFKNDRGKKIAALIHLLKSIHEFIEIIPSSKTKSLKRFYELLTGESKKYEAVRKCFDEKNKWNYTDKDEVLQSIKKKLHKIIQK